MHNYCAKIVIFFQQVYQMFHLSIIRQTNSPMPKLIPFDKPCIIISGVKISQTVATCTHPDATCSSVNVSHSDVRHVKSSLAVMDECHSQNFLRCLRDRMIYV